MMRLACFALLLSFAAPASAQYPWPVGQRDRSHEITGTFCEYRDTSANGHFHNGADVPAPDGTPVYAVQDAIVTSIDPNGSNAFVRAQNFAYVHIAPEPGLALGDSVFAGETVVGRILNGLGHVHVVDGYFDAEREPLRRDGGFTPYDDPWPPEIVSVRFRHAPTGQTLSPDALSGPVDILVHVEERNAPPTANASRRNNGTHLIGYKVLSADRQTPVVVPGDDGVQFRFDTKPPSIYVGNVFDKAQSSTSRHVYRVTNEVRRVTPLDVDTLAAGDYTVLVFTEDTRGNTDSVFVDVTVTRDDLVPPPPATFTGVTADAAGLHLDWRGDAAPDLAGYRLYTADEARGWTLALDEATLDGSAGSHDEAPLTEPTFFYLAAVDSAGNESERTDVYGAAPGTDRRHVLVVDGFDRHGGSGSWQQPTHDFAADHGLALADLGVGFSTVANEAVEQGEVALDEYDAVLWLLGDESTNAETFSAAEQALVRAYLEGGGRLFVTGSEIAWDLGARGSAADQAFLRDVLRVTYAGDDAGSLSANGVAGTLFDGLSLAYGSRPYREDYPDYYTPEGSQPVLLYGNGRTAGIAYEGVVGEGSAAAKLVLLGFPFETIGSPTWQRDLLDRVLTFFLEAPVATEPDAVRMPLALAPAYPNPSAMDATVRFSLPEQTHVQLAAYDVLGRRLALLADAPLGPGQHEARVETSGWPAGVYFVRLQTPLGVRTTRLVVAR